MKGTIRKKAGEDLSETQIEKVHKLLTQETPITKKAACDMLNIAYNTTRLNKIIDGQLEKKAIRKSRKKAIRNTPLSVWDAGIMISTYLEGDSLVDISNSIFRSIPFIKRTLVKYGIPLRDSDSTYMNPVMLPEDSWAEDYKHGDVVYSARYDCAAEIHSLYKKDKQHGNVYRVYLNKLERYAYQPYYELSDLRETSSKYTINMETMPWAESQPIIGSAIRKSRKGLKNE